MSVIVLGAGAAGLLAAIFAARGGEPVTVVDSSAKPGAKIRVSGGGRCNILPTQVSLDDFHTQGSRHAMRNVLFSWPLEDVRAFFEDDLQLPLKDELSGKVFPTSDRADDVIDVLMNALQRSGAILRASCRVERMENCDSGGFKLATSGGEELRCRRLVLATGGLSLPKSGSDGAGLAMALALGHNCVPTYPALVPLTSSDAGFRELSGVSVPARVTVERGDKKVDEAEGGLLFTHRGFSGPVILDLSHHVTRDGDVDLHVQWGGREVGDWDAILQQGGRATLTSVLRGDLPTRLGAFLIERAGIDSSARMCDLTREVRGRLVEVLGHFRLPVTGSEGYATAEVTGGGIPLAEVRPGTLESRVVPRLHLCGEIIDVTGRLGGYNFLWAWVSGRKVGRALAATSLR